MTTRDATKPEAGAPGYSGLQIALHWAILALVIAAWLFSDAMGPAMRAAAEGAVWLPLHVPLGMAVLVLMLARLVLRLVRPVASAPGPVGSLAWAASVTHWLLYALLLALPLSGAVAWFGGLRAAGEVHEVLWTALLAATALHVGAALFHQVVLRDGLMRRMLRPARTI